MKSTKSKLTPSLRFKGFVDPWATKSGSDIFISSRIKGNNRLPVYSVTLNKGMVPRESLDRRMEGDAEPGENLFVAQNDISYNMMRMWQGAYGLAPVDCMVSPAYVVLHPRENMLSQFFISLFARSRSLYLFTAYSYGLTSDRLRLYFRDFAKIKFLLPSIDEQKKIAAFLSAVNEKITQLMRKKELLEQYKKGVMQQIFSGKLRFKDEDGKPYPKWEDMRLGEIFEERSEPNHIDLELLSVSIAKGVYRQTAGSKRDTSNSDKSKYKRVCKGDLAYNSMRMWQGASAVSSYEGIISPAYTVLKGNSENNSIFFGYLFKMPSMTNLFQRYSQGLTSDTWTLKYSAISRMRILRPVQNEQQRIASFLSAIDSKIEIVSNQIEQTQTFKKGLLQQMFV